MEQLTDTGKDTVKRTNKVRNVVNALLLFEYDIELLRPAFCDWKEKYYALADKYDFDGLDNSLPEVDDEFYRIEQELDDALLAQYQQVDEGKFWKALLAGLVARGIVLADLHSTILDVIEEEFIRDSMESGDTDSSEDEDEDTEGEITDYSEGDLYGMKKSELVGLVLLLQRGEANPDASLFATSDNDFNHDFED